MRYGQHIISLLIAVVTSLLLFSAPIAAVETAAESIQFSESAAVDVPKLEIQTAKNNGNYLQKTSGYAAAQITFTDADGTVISDSGQIKVRGNTTQWASKKPYTIKFDSKHFIPALGSGRKFVLLANCFDPTLLRNYTALEIARALDLRYASKHMFAELWLDGVYKGCYEMVTPVQAGKDRVNIDVESNQGMQDFLIEYEATRDEANTVYFTAGGLRFVLHEPEDATAAQQSYVKSTMQSIMQTVQTLDYAKIRTRIDTESFAKFYLLNEFMKTVDFGFSSVYYYYQDGILYAGPPWDFDLSAGNETASISANYAQAIKTSGQYANKQIYSYLCKCPEFMEEVRQLYALQHGFFEHIYADGGLIDIAVQRYDGAFTRNFKTWNVATKHSILMRQPDATYSANVKYLKTWLRERDAWLSDYLKISSVNFAPLRGDVDGDGEVTAADAQFALLAYSDIISGEETGLTAKQMLAADVTGDGILSADDSQFILIYYINTVTGNTVIWDDLIAHPENYI